MQAHEEQHHPRRRRVSFSLSEDDADSRRLKASARRLARTKLMLSVVPLWVTFHEQTPVICHERRRGATHLEFQQANRRGGTGCEVWIINLQGRAFGRVPPS